MSNITVSMQDAFNLLESLDDNSTEIILTDPPYGITKGTAQNLWDKEIDWERFWNLVWKKLKPKGKAIIFSSDPFTAKLLASQPNTYKYQYVWEKGTPTGFLGIRYGPMRAFEMVNIFYKKAGKWNPQLWGESKKNKCAKSHAQPNGVHGKFYNVVHFENTNTLNTTKKPPINILNNETTESKVNKSSTYTRIPGAPMKPQPLLEWFIKSYTDEDDLIVDPFMGAGYMPDACKKLNRNFRGCDLRDNLIEIVKNRLQDN